VGNFLPKSADLPAKKKKRGKKGKKIIGKSVKNSRIFFHFLPLPVTSSLLAITSTSGGFFGLMEE